MRSALALAGVFAALGVAAAAATPAEELASARERWAERGSEHYSFTISNGCYCARASTGPLIVTVVDGVAKGPSALELLKDSPLRTTIPMVFDRIAEALSRFPAANFELEFDPVDGYPMHFAYDDPMIDDDQTDLVIEDFKHL